LRNRRLLIFAFCGVLFQLANASMLPLVSGMLASEGKRQAAPLVAALIIVPQLIVALLAPWVGQRAEMGANRSWSLGSPPCRSARRYLLSSATRMRWSSSKFWMV
jgi:hypothetical protein